MELSPLSHRAYSISEREEGDFLFVSDSGAEYSVYFTDGEGYAEGASFAQNIKLFGFQRLRRGITKPRVGHDERIMPTIIEVLHRTLTVFPDLIVIYVCSNASGLQYERSLIFSDWFKQWQESGGFPVKKIDYSLYNQLYCSCLFRVSHPDEIEINQVIDQLILMKP